MKTARILSIDGGGIRGLIPGQILSQWEKTLGPIKERFHMVAGTSTGGIIACGLCQGVPAQKLVDFYKKNGQAIFTQNVGALGGATGALYDAGPLEQAIAQVLHGNLSDIEKDLLITTYDLENRKPFLFKSWQTRGRDVTKDFAGDFDIRNIARATSAAPTYFEPAHVPNLSGQLYTFIDGGVYANNPALAAYVAARRLYPKASEYIIVSIGTGQVTRPYKFDAARAWGLVGWARPLLDVMFSGVSDTVDYELDQLSEVRHYRFQTNLAGINEDMDDASPENMGKLLAAAQGTVKKNEKAISELMKKLSAPITNLSTLGYPAPGKKLPSKKLIIPGKPLPPEPMPKIIPAGISASSALLGFALGGPVGAIIGAGAGLLGGLKLSEPPTGQ